MSTQALFQERYQIGNLACRERLDFMEELNENKTTNLSINKLEIIIFII